MSGQDRVQQLLEELLERPRSTPEEVCASDPNLLPEVRARWAQVRRVAHQLDELFPGSDSTTHPNSPESESVLPQIAGYTVESILGRGGMGVVFKARQLKPNRPVALKMLLAGSYASPQELARFLREVEAVATLRHPNIVQIYEVGDHAGRPYYTMEFVERGSLAQQLAQALPTPRRAAELVATLAVTVQFAHKSGIIHRDLKPANILLIAPLAEGGPGTPKIADFGLARFVDAEPELTFTGARLGTPNYMAPEQALGKTADIGPAADVYALGAILYESLAGHPPFDATSGAEIERRVISEEPTPPSRGNAKIPRDLETICLKCLHKTPARRYASAQDLADDLHRYLDGKPVLARPISIIERTVKWARRHPAATVLMASVLLVLATMTGVGVWAHQQENARQTEKAQREQQTRQGIESAVNKAYGSAQAERWEEAKRILANAKDQLDDANSPELHTQTTKAETDVRFAQELDRIRQAAATTVVESQVIRSVFDLVQSPVAPSEPSILHEEYVAAFTEAGISINGDEQETASRIRTSPLWEYTVAALDQWAFAAFTLDREALLQRLLRIARLVDPDANWRDRFRDAANWRDKQRLQALAPDAMKVSRTPAAHQLGIVGVLLRNLGETTDETRLLEEALRSRPADFWLNWEMTNSLVANKKSAEATAYLRVLVALRPDNPWARLRLGEAILRTGRSEIGIAIIRSGLERDPGNGVIRYKLAMKLYDANRPEEALDECQRAIEANPNDVWALFSKATLYQFLRRYAESAALFQKVVELEPRRVAAYCNLGSTLGWAGRLDEAIAAYRKTIELEPTHTVAHYGLGVGLLHQRKYSEAITEFRWVVDKLDPKKPPETITNVDDEYIAARQALVATLLGSGRIREAVDIAKTTLDYSGIEEGRRKAVTRDLAMGRRLAPLEARLPALLAGTEQPTDAQTRYAFAEWLSLHKYRSATAAGHYQIAFEQEPELAEELEAENRLNAACALVKAGTGMDDGGKLNATERASLRKQAQEWLRADYEMWKKRYQNSDFITQTAVARKIAEWQKNENLKRVRDEVWLLKLPVAERKEWLKLWSDVQALATSDPNERAKQARAFVGSKQWAAAAELYGKLLKDTPRLNSEVWFEYAAAQLLSGDRDGYQQTCKLMLERAAKPTVMRPYLAARACTLTPEAVEDQKRVSQICAEELQRASKFFWSLTEQGALQYRADNYEQAVALFEKSLRTDTKPGNAVLNWLWLAMAHHKLNNKDEARRWFAKASQWLDAQGNTLPNNAEEFGLHSHNWLEAHVLRREAESLLSR